MNKYPKETIMSYFKALDCHDYKTARSYMNDRLTVKGPSETFEDPNQLLEVLKTMKAKYNVKKVFVDGNDVCVLYNLTTTNPDVTVFMCSWYTVMDGKISSIQTIFDSTPFQQAPRG